MDTPLDSLTMRRLGQTLVHIKYLSLRVYHGEVELVLVSHCSFFLQPVDTVLLRMIVFCTLYIVLFSFRVVQVSSGQQVGPFPYDFADAEHCAEKSLPYC